MDLSGRPGQSTPEHLSDARAPHPAPTTATETLIAHGWREHGGIVSDGTSERRFVLAVAACPHLRRGHTGVVHLRELHETARGLRARLAQCDVCAGGVP
jgi:hypothetical protein